MIRPTPESTRTDPLFPSTTLFRSEDIFVIQSTSYPANDNLMGLLIMIDALRRASAKRITAVLPYFGYARQDRKPGPRTPISAKLVANLITVRSEEHTSELQSLMRNSYADFCLQKKNNKKHMH